MILFFLLTPGLVASFCRKNIEIRLFLYNLCLTRMLSPCQYYVHFLLAFYGALGLCLKGCVNKEEHIVLAQHELKEDGNNYDIRIHSSYLHAHTSGTFENLSSLRPEIARRDLFLDEWVYGTLRHQTPETWI